MRSCSVDKRLNTENRVWSVTEFTLGNPEGYGKTSHAFIESAAEVWPGLIDRYAELPPTA